MREQHGTVAPEHCGQAVDRQSAQSERSLAHVMLEEETAEVVEVCMQNAPVVCEAPVLVRGSEITNEDDVCKQISLLHRKPRKKKPDFASHEESDKYEVDREINY